MRRNVTGGANHGRSARSLTPHRPSPPKSTPDTGPGANWNSKVNDTEQVGAAASSAARRYPLNVFRRVTAKRPDSAGHVIAEQLATQLRRVQRVERKDLAPLATLVSYHESAESRCIADINTVHAVYGDIDKDFDPEAFEVGLRELESAGVQVIAHQTYRHTDEAPRWRIYVLLDEPIRPADYLACWEGLNAIFGGMLDGNAKDCARLNYWPSCPPGETRELRTLNIEGPA